MDLSLFDFIGNDIGNVDIAAKVKNYLFEKYNDNFIVWKIGERYGTSDFTKAKIYCSQEKNELNIFSVIYDMKERKILRDDFILKSICFDLEKDIYNIIFQNFNIKAIIKIEIVTNKDIQKKCSLQEFLSQESNTRFLANIVFNQKISENEIIKILDILRSKYENIVLISNIYSIKDSDFIRFYDRVKNLPNISDNIVEEYEIENYNKITINNNEIIKIK